MKNIEKYLRENGYADRGLNEKFEFRDIHKVEADQGSGNRTDMFSASRGMFKSPYEGQN